MVVAKQVVRADDKVLARFSKSAAPLLARMAQSERESRTVAALRDTLLPKLISGELRVPQSVLHSVSKPNVINKHDQRGRE